MFPALAAIESPFTLFEPLFAQRAALAVLIVCLLAAALGPLIVLRDLPFYTHSLGAGAYPFLVLAVASGMALAAGAVAGCLVFALALGLLTRRVTTADRRDALTAIAVAAALGAGAVAGSVAATGNQRLAAPPEALLFGSVLTVGSGAIVFAGSVAVLVTALAWLQRDRWLARGFDSGVAAQIAAPGGDLPLLAAIALAVAAALPVTGALMAGSLLIVPAASARLVVDRAGAMAPVTFLLAAVAGALGLYCSLAFDLPAGAAIAAAAGLEFVVVALVQWARALTARRTLPALAALLLAVLALAGCGSGSGANEPGDQRLDVVATTTQVADIVRQVGGDAVSVTTLLPPGADPHAFEPKPSAVAKLAGADLVVRSGGDLDGWLEPSLKAAGSSKKPVDLSNAATLLPEGGGDAVNAHWFLSPANLQAATQRTRDELVKADPAARETFRANAGAYVELIDRTTAALRSCVDKLASGQRSIATGHDDFDYLADAFGLKIAAQLADTGQTEPSVKDVQTAVDQARAGKARSLVTSRGETSRLAVAVAHKLNVPLLELYSDSLAKSGPAAGALGAIAFNLGAIVEANSNGTVKCPAAPSA